jgi:molybdopterin-guanine dinucleotide biosynthesis protein B
MSRKRTDPLIICIVGQSDAGKTTLIEKLIPEFRNRGLKVGTIKHDVHGFDMDRPGKDSWRHKQAGALTTVISSPNKIGMVMDVDHDHKLEELSPFLCGMDMVLAEGFKRQNHPKVEVFRPRDPLTEPLCMGDESLVALVSDISVDLGVPRFALDDVQGLAEHLASHFRLINHIAAGKMEIAS